MRTIAALLAVALLPVCAKAQTPHVPTFAGIPWGASGPDVVKAVTAIGFDLVEQDGDGDYHFAGELFGAPAIVYTIMSPVSGLVKVQVRLATPDAHARVKYEEVLKSMVLRYGATEEVELYKPPYQKGDGREDEAVDVGQGLLFSTWGEDVEPGQASLVVRATKRIVALDYEAHEWNAEVHRRRTRATASL
jgi:hypothetical protein